jgi:hypothetical protein
MLGSVLFLLDNKIYVLVIVFLTRGNSAPRKNNYSNFLFVSSFVTAVSKKAPLMFYSCRLKSTTMLRQNNWPQAVGQLGLFCQPLDPLPVRWKWNQKIFHTALLFLLTGSLAVAPFGLDRSTFH